MVMASLHSTATEMLAKADTIPEKNVYTLREGTKDGPK